MIRDMTRTEAPLVADEITMLAGWLDWHRQTFALKCAGLTGAELTTRSVAPSSLSLFGLLRHLVEVERGWFREVLAQEETPPLYYSDGDPDGDFDNIDGATDPDIAATWDRWHAECTRSREIAAALPSLDVTFPRRDEVFSARWVMIHMIEEYARHNGHADLLRERTDGETGE